MNLRFSRYTVSVRHNDKLCLYNTLTGRSVVLSMPTGEPTLEFSTLLQESRVIVPLLRTGLVVDDKADEILALQKEYQECKANQPLTCLIVIPSYACNCACPDCYQLGYDTSRHFTEKTYAAIREFAGHILRRGRTKVLALYLYGGEPFLQASHCGQLLDSLAEDCRENEAHFHTVVATNGTAVTTPAELDLARKVDEVYLSMCQSEHEQACRRPLQNGTSSYARLLRGISVFAGLNKSVRVRINVSAIERLARDLETTCDEIKNAAGPNYAQLWFEFSLLHTARTGCSAEIPVADKKNDDAERMYAKVRRVGNPFTWPRNRFLLPKSGSRKLGHSALRDGPCPYLNGTRFVITPDGMFRTCNPLKDKPEYVLCGVEEYDQLSSTPLYQRLTRELAWEDPECIRCEYLPLCLTRCGVRALDHGGRLHWEGCKAEQRRRVEVYTQTLTI